MARPGSWRLRLRRMWQRSWRHEPTRCPRRLDHAPAVRAAGPGSWGGGATAGAAGNRPAPDCGRPLGEGPGAVRLSRQRQRTPQLELEAKVASWWRHFQPLQSLPLPVDLVVSGSADAERLAGCWWCSPNPLRRTNSHFGGSIMIDVGRRAC
jgi:hypothetical protein